MGDVTLAAQERLAGRADRLRAALVAEPLDQPVQRIDEHGSVSDLRKRTARIPEPGSFPVGELPTQAGSGQPDQGPGALEPPADVVDDLLRPGSTPAGQADQRLVDLGTGEPPDALRNRLVGLDLEGHHRLRDRPISRSDPRLQPRRLARPDVPDNRSSGLRDTMISLVHWQTGEHN
jgi:hypothetical protein